MVGKAGARLFSRATVTCLAVLTAISSAAADPAAAQPSTERPQLEVSAEFDKPVYRTGEQISITVRVRNVGTERAVGLGATTFMTSVPTDLQFDPAQWGALNRFFGQPGATIEPGATFETTLTGQQGKLDADTVTLTGFVFDQSGFGVASFAFTAPITLVTSHVAGTIFGDRNGNGVFDNGEEAPGATMTLNFRFVFSVTATTDAGGRFDFGEIPTAAYGLTGTVPDFLFGFVPLTIDAAHDNSNLLFRAVPPLNGALHASMKFTRNKYRPGDVAHVRIALRNSGSIPLTGIVASCNRADEGPSLNGVGPGWGALAANMAGVTIPPGRTSVFDVSEPLPASAVDFGYAIVGCDFNYADGVLDETGPVAGDTVRVPGGAATLSARVTVPSVTPDPSQPIVGLPGVGVTLVHGHGHVVGRTTTDGNGHFEFPGLAPGPDYTLRFAMPAEWTLPDQEISVIANRGEMVFVANPSQAG